MLGISMPSNTYTLLEGDIGASGLKDSGLVAWLQNLRANVQASIQVSGMRGASVWKSVNVIIVGKVACIRRKEGGLGDIGVVALALILRETLSAND